MKPLSKAETLAQEFCARYAEIAPAFAVPTMPPHLNASVVIAVFEAMGNQAPRPSVETAS